MQQVSSPVSCLFPVASFQETLDLSTRKEESGNRKAGKLASIMRKVVGK